MSIDSLLQDLQSPSRPAGTTNYCNLQLPIEDAARLAALAALYPQHDQDTILSLLLSHGLQQMDQLTKQQTN